MSLPVLGIDISKKKFHACLLLGNGKARKKSFPNTDEGHRHLVVWLARHDTPRAHACMEATGTYAEDLAEHLHRSDHAVSLVNPGRIGAFARSVLARTKTDQADAELIARFCQMHRPAAWAPAAAEVRQLQGLLRRLDALTEMRVQERNRLEGARGEAAESIRVITEHLEEEIRRVKGLISDHTRAHPQLKEKAALLETIPGVGSLTAAWLLAELPAGLGSAREAAAYAGLVPEERQSGTSVRGRARLSKKGNGRLRKALYMPALSAKRYNPVVRAFCAGLLGRGKAKGAVVGAAMRKLLHIAFGVLKNGVPFDPNYAAAS